MEQQALFHEDINDALRSAVKACGGTKFVASKLWPEKGVNDAQSYLNDCLNTARSAKLSPEQVLLLLRWAREAGCHDAINYLCAATGYEHPVPVNPEDELSRLIREYMDIQKRSDHLKPRIDEAISKMRVAK